MATQTAPQISAGALKSKGFKVYEVSRPENPTHVHGRRDYYKIVLVTGDMTICYGDKNIEIDGTFLFFANPHVPHTVIHRSTERKGYACLFTEAFIVNRERTEILQNSPLFRFDGIAVIPVNAEQAIFLTGLYQKMIAVHSEDYPYKDELLKSCIELIIHEALRIQPQNGMKEKNASTRITYLFLELLERQFPIEDTKAPLTLRTAQDFASALSVHVNYLNRSVKTVTGKPTSVHIAERITAEAKALLQHTNWSIADIAYSLGFEYPTYFNNYFKRLTGLAPNSFRKGKV
jgi:AraC-like DNA-binding protein